MKKRSLKSWKAVVLAVLVTAGGLLSSAYLPLNAKLPFGLPLLWPEEQRAFLQDGPGLLLGKEKVEELADRDVVGRRQMMDEVLADPVPETPQNEMLEAIERRRALVRRAVPSFGDARAQVLFLHGAPVRWEIVDCVEVYRPMELWTYPDVDGEGFRVLVFYQEKPRQFYKLWLPLDSKRILYNEEMEYWLQQLAELGRQVRGVRFDFQICDRARHIDLVTGVSGLYGFMKNRPKNDDFLAFLEPPEDLAAWAREAAESRVTLPEPYVFDKKLAKEERQAAVNAAEARERDVSESPFGEHQVALDVATLGFIPAEPTPADFELPTTAEGELDVFFPERENQRMVSRLLIKIPAEIPLEPFVEEDRQELRLTLEGILERNGQPFEQFRVRYLLPPPEEGVPVALAVERRLRPEQEFLLRLKIVEEISGLELYFNHGFVVPNRPTPPDELPVVPEAVIESLAEELRKRRVAGYDSLLIIPPETDVVFGLWRADALVTGQRIEKVVFYLDDKPIMSRRRPPFTAELRLQTFPVEQIVRVEGYDGDGELVAADEVILNQPRGELNVRILEPARGRAVEAGPTKVRAEVVVPEEERVTKVSFLINDDVQAEVEKPPWEATIDVPATSALTYINVVAELENGQRAEAVRFLNAPDYMEEVDVNLVELYTTVSDKAGFLIRDLVAEDFEIFEDSRPQKISKFQLVEDLPLTLGIVIDSSGSMFESMGEARRAALGFLENILTPRDRVFALAFSSRPVLLMPRTSDVGAVKARLEGLMANGATALHDAIVTSLYYYRGIRGRRAMVLLSDGEDTASTIGFRETLEYAKRSGVAVYTIGLRIGKTSTGVRRKLASLSQETGGRTFFIKTAVELDAVYAEIERELRSQYLLAYNSDQEGEPDVYHEIEVKVRKGKLEARTIRGYYS